MKKIISLALLLVSCVSLWAQLSGYAYRMPVTIQSSVVSGSGSLTNFPFLVSVTNTNLRSVCAGGRVHSGAGNDIRFTTSDGTTLLSYEIESYDSSAGSLLAWVRIPSLPSSSNTQVYVYFGNPAGSVSGSSTGTWDTNHKGVWHLGSMSDATANSSNGTNNSTTDVAGKIGRARSFNGSSAFIRIPHASSQVVTNAITLSAWVRASSFPAGFKSVLSKQNGTGSDDSYQLHVNGSNPGGFTSVCGASSSTSLSTNTWHYIAFTGSGTTRRVYLNGVQLNTSTCSSWTNDNNPIILGGNENTSGSTINEFLSGLIDEVHFSTTERSADWLRTEYNNQNNPSSSISLGTLEILTSSNLIANAGADISQCNTSTFAMNANAPAVGTGTWSVVSGTATIANANSRTTNVTVNAGNTATLRWSFRNNVCIYSSDTILLANNAAATSSNAGSDQTITATTATLNGNNPSVGSGLWTFISGPSTPTIASPSSRNSSLSNLNSVGSYVFRWTITNGSCTSFDEVTITRSIAPVASNITNECLGDTAGNTIISALFATDADGTIANYTIVTIPNSSQGVLRLNGSAVTASQSISLAQASQLTFDPLAGFSGNASFTYRATDNAGANSNTATFTIPVYSASVADLATNYLNVSKGNSGGTMNVGDTIEIRSIVLVNSGNIINNVSYINTIPANTQYIPNSLRVLTNEGTVYKSFTDASGDDQGTRSGSNITINLGTGATSSAGGTIDGDNSIPRFAGSALLVASFRVRITGSVGSNIDYGGTLNFSTTCNVSVDFRPSSIRVTAPQTCGGVAINQSVLFETNGTFGSGTAHNRSTASSSVNGYNFVNLSSSNPGDGNYSIVKNTSPNQVTSSSQPNPSSNRVFQVWDVIGDHTGASNTSTGNSPSASGANGGYMLVVNASYLPDIAFEQSVSGLSANRTYDIGLWVRNICSACGWDSTGNNSTGPGVPPNLTFILDGKSYYTTGNIAYTNTWVYRSFQYTTGAGQTSFALSIQNNSPGGGGNDWALDDIAISLCNAVPVASNITNTLLPDTATARNISALSATDADGTIASYRIVTIPSAGSGILRLNGVAVTAGQTITVAQGSQLTFDPVTGFNGNASFTYTANDNNGTTSNVATFTIPVAWVATSNAGANQNRCNGSNTFSLSANTPVAGSGLWTLVSGTATIANSSAQNTNVTVAVGNTVVLRWTVTSSPYSAFSELTINHLNMPSASIAGTNTICSGASSTFTATGGASYVWSTSATTASIAVSTAGTYTVTVTNAAGCTATANRALTVNANPTASISGTNTICAGASSTFTASGGVSYVWSTGATTAAISVSTAGTYTVTATNAAGCTATANRTLTVNALPTPSVSGTNTICAGASSTFTATGGSSYVWSTGATTASITISTAGTYTVTATSAAGCTATANRTLTVNALPTPSIGGTNTICSGASSTFTASGGTSYAWSTGATTAAITVSTAATYRVTVTSNGCTATANRALTVNTSPTAAISGTQSVCSGSSSTFTASGGGTYAWSTGATASAISVSTTGTYTVTVTAANGCTSTANRALTVNANPTTANAGSNQTQCGNSTFAMAANTPSSGSGTWSVVSGSASIANASSPTTSVTGVAAGAAATLRWTIASAGCTSSTSDVTLTNNTAPTTASAGPNQSRCGGGSTFTLAANTAASGTGAWSVVSGTANILNTSSPTSTVQVLSGNTAVLRWSISKAGCTSSTSDVTIANLYSAAPANAGADQTKCGTSFTLNGNNTKMVVVTNTTIASTGLNGTATSQAYGGTPPYTYLWSTGATTQNLSNLPTGTYGLTVSDAAGNQIERQLEIVGLENALTRGAFLVNMGSTSQTFNNSMKPYGMVYDLVNNHNVPVKWIINPSKAKDAEDFNHNGVSYKGSSFAVPAEFRTAKIDSVINVWISRGVVGATSVQDLVLPVAKVITSFPSMVVDEDNENLVLPIFTNAGIPSSIYHVGLPSDLSSCDDMYALPHADPTWADHNYLYTFNNQGGYIWSGCHAVSMFEGLFNPSNPSQRMNFLSTTGLQCYSSGKCGTSVTQTHAGSPTTPYTYNASASTHPIMQFMGDMTPATESGSEKWFIPQTTGAWRNGVVRAVTTSNGTVGKEGVKLVFGYGFGDTTKGMVMYEGGHNITSTGSTAAQVAAQRAFLNFTLLAGNNKKLSISHNIIENYIAGSTSNVSVNVSGGTAPYTYTWSSTGEIFLSATNTASINITVPEFETGTKCFLTCVVMDACGRKNFISMPINSINMPPDENELSVRGYWRRVSGTATISDSTKSNATATIAQGTTARLEWRVEGGACGTTRDTVSLTSVQMPTTANAGPDQSRINGANTFSLAGNIPSVGTGVWRVASGTATIADTTSAVSVVTVPLRETATLVWRTTNGICSTTDTMVIIHRSIGCYALNNTEWNTPSTWAGNCTGLGGYPTINDTAIISGKTVTVSGVSAAKFLWMDEQLGRATLNVLNGGQLTIAQDIDMDALTQNNVRIDLANNSRLNIGGTITRNPSPNNFGRITSHASSTITFNGVALQTIPTSRGRGSDAIQYQNVVFNNTSGVSPAFVAEGRVDVANTITLTRGCLDMGRDTIMLTNNSYTSLGGGHDSSYVMGQFCRYIGQSGQTYRWSVGRRGKEGEYWFELKNNLLVGTSYVCVEFDSVPDDSRAGINYADQDITATQLAEDGIWRVEPDAQPTLGGYDVNASTVHFSGLVDNNFGLLKRPTRSAVTNWGKGGGMLPSLGNPLRTKGNRFTALSTLTSFSEFGIGSGGGGSLPVKLTVFEAKPVENKYIKLKWVTETEIDNMGFEIHRSKDGVEFDNIGWVNGNGSTTETKVYDYDDKTIDPNIRYYYRLKQIDFDAKFEYSPIATAEIRNVGGVLEIGEFTPNPAKATTSISVNTENDMDAEVIFFDMMGRVTKSGTVSMAKGSHVYYFDINELVSGNYIVAIVTSGTKHSKRLIVY